MNTITKHDFIAKVASTAEAKKNMNIEDGKYIKVTQKDTGIILESIIDVMADILKNEDKLVLTGFMSMEALDVPERKCVNPQTGEGVISPAHKKVKMKPGKILKDAANGISEYGSVTFNERQ